MTKNKRMLTDEYMQELERRIDNMMQRYELYRNPNDRMILECMVQDYEAKQRLMMQDEKLKEVQSPFSPSAW
jgi:negative regulator of sigma E activity